MKLDEAEIHSLVQEILKRINFQEQDWIPAPYRSTGQAPAGMTKPVGTAVSRDETVCPSVEEAVAVSEKAQKKFQEMGLDLRRKIIDSIRKAGVDHAEPLAKMAQRETGLGRWEHKVQKNILVSLKTPGVEDLQPVKAYTGDKGLTLIEYSPMGVVASVTPSTNPTSTIINNSISILSAGNSVVFSPHPAAKNCCQETMKILNQAITGAGGPPGLITTVDPASQETTVELLKNPKVGMAIVTGGKAIVKVAMAQGLTRKTICAGPGNPPVIVDDTADMKAAAEGIIDGASFDNCILCTGEKEVIVTQSAAERLLSELRRDPRAYELTCAQMDEVARLAFKTVASGGEPVLNKDFVGKNANVIARFIGLNLPDDILLLWGVVPNDHPLIWTEQLMPVIPVTMAANIESAVALAKEAEGHNHHTASIYSMHVGHITKAARQMACSIFVKNGPTYMGLGLGEGFATMSIGTPTGDGLTKPTHFSRPLHCSMVGYLRIA